MTRETATATITIVDYGMGNLGSIVNMLKKIGSPCLVSSDPDVIGRADKLILPGVGAFDAAMARIESLGLRPALDRRVLEHRVPVLGICLGMQLLGEYSEEGNCRGLGWVPAEVLAFRGRVDSSVRVPHMGWNIVHAAAPSVLSQGFDRTVATRFYFVHSYFVRCRDGSDVALRCEYGLEFTAGIQRENVYGVQFHPEKSHRFGMQLLSDFADV